MNNAAMRTVFVVCLFCVTACATATTKKFVNNPHRLESVQRIAVIPFSSKNTDMGSAVAESLSANLLNSRFTVIERTQLDKILAEQGLSLSGVLLDQQSIIGKIKGIDAIIVGSATISNGFAGWLNGGYRDYISNCSARLIDVATGEILFAATYTSSRPRNQHGFVTPTDVGELLAQELIQIDQANHR
jgi:curli biogenesis system outer membrane secretion channel CsgG